VRDVIRETCRALVELGVQRVVILTFHGAPLHNLAIEAGLAVLRKAGVRAVAPFNLVMQEQLTLDPSEFKDTVKHLDEPLRTQILEGLRYDFHAGFFETSVTLHYAPQAVSPIYKDLPPCPAFGDDRVTAGIHRVVPAGVFASEVRFVSRAMGWMNLRPFNAYTSHPALATPEAGAVFAESMLDKFEAPTVASLLGSGLGTQPIMPWLRFLSLGGRVAKAPHIPLDQMRL
jgi:creatinine amidohydrolase